MSSRCPPARNASITACVRSSAAVSARTAAHRSASAARYAATASPRDSNMGSRIGHDSTRPGPTPRRTRCSPAGATMIVVQPNSPTDAVDRPPRRDPQMLLADERAELVDYCLRMQADELTVGTSGNLSIRSGDLVAITPSGVAYDELTPESICVIGLDGARVDADLAPSSELPMHTSVYRATDARAVVHTHPLYGTALSVTLDEVPPVHYMLALLGGPVRVVPYARFGSDELAANSVAGLADRFGVL